MDDYRAAWERLPEGPKPERAPEYTPTTEQARLGYAHDSGLLERFSDEAYKREVAEAEGEFNRWLTEHDRVVAANAWDEGYDAGDEALGITRDSNPYRITEENN